MKTRLIAVMLVLCICMTMIPVKAEAATSGMCGSNVSFSFNGSTGLLKIYGTGDMWEFQYNYGYSSAPWWEYVANIKKIEIGSGVTRIGNTAFNGCWNAESITIPATVTSIGSRAFYGCTALTSITIPSGVTAIGDYAFYRTGITEIDLPDGITSLGDGAFADSGLTSIDIPAGVTTISVDLLANCDNLEKVTIRGDITNIGESAFYSAAVKEVVFKGTLSGEIGDHAFAYCENLAAFHVPGTVTRIKANAFCGCEGMTELILEEGITSIGELAFRQTGISALTIPSTVNYFGGRIADFADNLKNVTMYTPTVEICKTWIFDMDDLDYVHIIGDAPETTVKVFSSTSQATDFVVYYDEGTSGWEGDTWNGYKIEMWGKPKPIATGTWGDNITWELGFDGTLIVSGEGKVAENRAEPYPWKEYADRIIKVIFEEGVTNVPVSAFEYSYPNLTSAELKSVEIIESTAFAQCTALTSITLPDTLTEIDNGAFSDAGLTTIDIPEGVTRIGLSAFSSSKLTEIALPEGLLEIGDGAFSWCEDLKSAYLPDSITTVGMGLFSNCTALETANIPKNLTYVPESMFSGCSSLKSIEIPDGITASYMNDFEGTALTTVTIPASVTILVSSFMNCLELKEIIFEGDAPEIYDFCFENVVATAYYPAGNATWTEEVLKDYGGDITWVPYGEVEKDYTITWKEAYASLGGNIAVVFKADLSKDLIADPNAFMRFTYAGKTVDVPVNEATKSGNYYTFYCRITSVNMTDDITAQMMVGEEAIGRSVTTSLEKYCSYIISNSTDTKTVNLMKAMLNYGAAAQKMMNYKPDNLANKSLSDADKVLTAVDATQYKHSITGTEDGIKPVEALLVLGSETTIRVGFQLTGSKSIEEYTFTVDGVEVEPVLKGGKYVLEVPNIAAHRLDEYHSFTCGGITVTYCGLSYVNQVMGYYTEGTTFDMAAALYNYSQATEAYTN